MASIDPIPPSLSLRHSIVLGAGDALHRLQRLHVLAILQCCQVKGGEVFSAPIPCLYRERMQHLQVGISPHDGDAFE